MKRGEENKWRWQTYLTPLMDHKCGLSIKHMLIPIRFIVSPTIFFIIMGDKPIPPIKATIKKPIKKINLFLNSLKCSIACASKIITSIF